MYPDGAINDLKPDLTDADGWQALDTATQARIVDAAQLYLVKRRILDAAWLRAPEEMLSIARRILLAPEREDACFTVLPHFDDRWKEAIEKVLMEVISLSSRADVRANVLDGLLRRQFTPAKEIAVGWLAGASSEDGPARSRALTAARLLLAHDSDGGAWELVWPAILGNIEFGRSLLEQLAHGSFGVGFHANRLSEKQLADLYIWLAEQYPDFEVNVNGFASPDISLKLWRHDILAALEGRGAYEACEQLARLARELPHLRWLSDTYLRALEYARVKAWKPLSVGEILSLVRDTKNRLVRSSVELQDVVVEALRNWERELQGQRLRARQLWNDTGAGWRPYTEVEFSDEAAVFLESELSTRGIVVNCEVQVRRVGQSHERLDLLVEATMKDAASGGACHCFCNCGSQRVLAQRTA